MAILAARLPYPRRPLRRLRAHPWRTLAAVLVMLATVAGTFVGYTGLYRLAQPRPADRDTAITQVMAAARIPGAALATLGDGKPVSARGFGVADPATGRPVTPDTLFTIASVSKTVTATAVMTLQERGTVGLDDDVNRYLPFPVRNPRFPDRPITVRMLLQHTSGIQDSDAYGERYTLGSTPVLADSPIPLASYLQDYLAPAGRRYDAEQNYGAEPPGARYAYSNTAFGLVGYLVEQISGQPFDVYCEQAVFAPLGMTHSAWRYADVDPERMAVPYGYDDLRRVPERIGFYGYPTYPDGALKTSVTDYARFLTVFLTEGRTAEGTPFLRPDTVAEMLRRTTVPGLEAPATVGLAWHSDGTSYGHDGMDPGIFTQVLFDPASGRGAILFTTGVDYDDPTTTVLRQLALDPAGTIRALVSTAQLSVIVTQEVAG